MDERVFAEQRKKMVSEQIVGQGIRDPRIAAAMGKVPRHLFVPQESRAHAYEDRPAPIGQGQTVSQPYMVAFMVEILRVKEGDRVLEIGTGCGYQAAVLQELGTEVYSVEILPELARLALNNLRGSSYDAFKIKTGDGARGWPEFAPYDAILVACAPEEVPPALPDQLKEGGRLVIPLGTEKGIQNLHLFEKKQGRIQDRALAPVRFVPMTGEAGKSAPDAGGGCDGANA